MSQWNDPQKGELPASGNEPPASGNEPPASGNEPPVSFLNRLSIRAGLMLGFGAMGVVMILAVLAALIVSSTLLSSVGQFLDSQLPATIHTFRVARAADALVASGMPLASITTTSERDIAFERIDINCNTLKSILSTQEKRFGDSNHIFMGLLTDLTDNLQRLRAIVDERITLKQKKSDTKEKLISNLLTFQQHLTYRVRILESDGAVIQRLISRSQPPAHQIANMAGELAGLLPIATFFAKIESFNSSLMGASQDPDLAELNISEKMLDLSLDDIEESLKKLPGDLKQSLLKPTHDLRRLAFGEEGLIPLRERELTLNSEGQVLIHQNQEVTGKVDEAVSIIVNSGLNDINQTRDHLSTLRQRATIFLITATAFGLIALFVLVKYHVDRHVLVRLSWLSRAMQDVAAGRLETSLPPAGPNELGRLGAALRQFRNTAAEAKERENALFASNKRAEDALALLKEKANELEIANGTLAELSIRDPLTGLFNRRRFDEALINEWRRSGHGKQPITLLMLDVDYFKKFNDGYGHQMGDECLKRIAAILQNNSRRAGDVAARYGGEEFSLISPYSGRANADELVQRIHQSIIDLAIPHKDSPFGIVTASMGYTVAVPDENNAPEGLIAAADSALYQAKNSGRNHFIFSETGAL